jgi:hypothetical protein
MAEILGFFPLCFPRVASIKTRRKDEKKEADHDTLAMRALDMETKAPAAPGSPDVGFRLARRPDACRGAWTNEGESN